MAAKGQATSQWWHCKDSSGAVIACPSAERIVIWCPAWIVLSKAPWEMSYLSSACKKP
ncbi:hypothetical protein Q5P01_012886 [Channa striata]|uniref:Uncharacterized protein n=1 Tax=Channa striata TaxID=64152 RepID=A0AA88MSN6_CHASR|nr:hypothetical protein Q5P01_012886 [Channa striata]